MNSTTEKEEERALLVGLSSPVLSEEENANYETIDELEELLKTAGGVCEGIVLQNRAKPDAGSFIGEGKANEIKEFIKNNDINLVVFDNNLSPSQTRTLEKIFDCHVMDRNALILDIFAKRAKTKEGKLQVELAQYQYLLPRLSGMWKHLVRQTSSGGKSPIGTRGPGETQLETDRRHIHERIKKIKEDLEEVKSVRDTQRRNREKNNIPVAAIVGYTNAGKSTLLNHLTGANIEANDRLFDTLDTTTRILTLPNEQNVLISDTVGFIRKLPHTLIEAFKATLDELAYADLILHVIDLSNEKWEEQAAVTESLIQELCPQDVPKVRVFNKIDKCSSVTKKQTNDAVWISAKKGEGIDHLKEIISNYLSVSTVEVNFRFPYNRAGLVDCIFQEAKVKNVEYSESAIYVKAVCDKKTSLKYSTFIQNA